MPQSYGFKPCTVCHKHMPISYPHTSGKQREPGRSPSKKKSRKVAMGTGPVLSHPSAPGLQGAVSLARAPSPIREPPPTPGSSWGPRHLTVPLMPGAFQTAKDLMALRVLPSPQEADARKAPSPKGKPQMGPPQWLVQGRRSPEPHQSSSPVSSSTPTVISAEFMVSGSTFPVSGSKA